MFKKKESVKRGISSKESRNKRLNNFKDAKVKQRDAYFAKRRMVEKQSPSSQNSLTTINFKQFPNNWMQQLFSTQYQNIIYHIRKTTSQEVINEEVVIAPLCQSNVLQRFHQLLATTQSDQEIFQILWIITNITSSETTDAYSKMVVEAKLVPIIVRHLLSKNTKIVEQAIWTLANILSEHDTAYGSHVAQQNMVSAILYIAKTYSNNQAIMTEVFRATAQICRSIDTEQINILLPLLSAALSQQEHEDYNIEALRGVSYIIERDDTEVNMVEIIIKSGIAAKCITLCESRNASVFRSCLSIIGSCLCSDVECTNAMMNMNIVPFMKTYMEKYMEDDDTRAEKICWMASNIIRESKQHAMVIINAKMLPLFFKLWEITRRGNTQRELIYVFSDLCKLTIPELSKALIEQGVLWIFYNSILVHDRSVACLEGLLHITNINTEWFNAVWEKETSNCDSGSRRLQELTNSDNPVIKYLLVDLMKATSHTLPGLQ